MGAEGAVSILYRKEIAACADPAAECARRSADYREKFSNPYRAAASGYVDDVLIPAETRPRLIAALELLRDKQTSLPAKKHGCMPL
jgi:propionyl-CoA carboxylase beta chain